MKDSARGPAVPVQFVGQQAGRVKGGLGRYENAFVDRLGGAERFVHREVGPLPVPKWLRKTADRLPYDVDYVVENNPLYVSDTSDADVTHIANQMLAPNVYQYRSSTVVVTVHDVEPARFGSTRPTSVAGLKNAIMVRALRRADHLIAVSSNTKTDLVDRLGFASEDVSVVYNGVDFSKFFPGSAERTRAADPGQTATLLYVGSLLPRKDVPTLFRSFRRVRDRLSAELLVVGSARGRKGKHRGLLEQLGIEDDVRFVDSVDEERLVEVYRSADVLLMPSKYEGFGLPVLEAMAAGTPVVSTDGGSLPEVVGSAGLLVPVGAASRMAYHVVRLLEDDELYDDLVQSGYRAAENFSWERTVENTLAVYDAVS